jgi:hypothetical protein
MTVFTPRPSQQNILRYTGGRLGIAAVPGAGKMHILDVLMVDADSEEVKKTYRVSHNLVNKNFDFPS